MSGKPLKFITYDKQLAREKLNETVAKHPTSSITVFQAEYGSASFNIAVEADTIESALSEMDAFVKSQGLSRDNMKGILWDAMRENRHTKYPTHVANLLTWVLCQAAPVIEGLAKDGGHIIGGTFTDRPAPDGGTFLDCRIRVQNQLDAQAAR